MDKIDFEIAVGAAAQDAVWNTQHPLTHHLSEDDPLRVEYLREYQRSVGRQVLAAIEKLWCRGSSANALSHGFDAPEIPDEQGLAWPQAQPLANGSEAGFGHPS
ncbi:hypothetical protein [Mycobacterium sp. Marseille-P9652]|uniref:hypothetical protein n=1 Tax=Mycobacterium sp. Marseille-P9652 TaxID=2654950 RepID=UPI0012E97C7B|nr:hypothetical protein [Mycobacterium sp. Marseille-P9652]